MVRRMLFDTIDLSWYPAFCRTFSLPFQISYHIGKALQAFFNKNEGNNLVENKVSGRVRVGVGRALLSQ